MSVSQTATIDSTLIIALISLTTSLLTTFGALLVKSYVDAKRIDKRRVTKQLEYINTKVYSPLLFNLFEAFDNLSFITGCLQGFNETKEVLVKENRQLIIQELKERCDLRYSNLRDILLDKIALINPQIFRQQLFFFLQSFKMYEQNVKKFTDEGFSEIFIEQDLKFLENLQVASLDLCEKASLFIAFVDTLIQKGEKVQSSPKIFTNEEMLRLNDLIESRNTLIAREIDAKGLLNTNKT